MSQIKKAAKIVQLLTTAMDTADNFGDVEDEEMGTMLDFLYEKLGDAAFCATKVLVCLKGAKR